ncbi:MAG: hypothetical protein EOO30_12135 [Comamonadaceae bacterium]|nr:MAG: hypothetical protein EOO30_12135 [Comamonadaceae bacterium]
MNQPPDKPRINIVLPGKADVLKHFTRHCAFVKVVVVLILTLPAIGFSGAAALYAAHQVGLLRTVEGANSHRAHQVQQQGTAAVLRPGTTSVQGPSPARASTSLAALGGF